MEKIDVSVNGCLERVDALYDHASKSGSHPQLRYKTEAGEFLPRTSAWITMVEVLDCLY